MHDYEAFGKDGGHIHESHRAKTNEPQELCVIKKYRGSG